MRGRGNSELCRSRYVLYFTVPQRRSETMANKNQFSIRFRHFSTGNSNSTGEARSADEFKADVLTEMKMAGPVFCEATGNTS